MSHIISYLLYSTRLLKGLPQQAYIATVLFQFCKSPQKHSWRDSRYLIHNI